MKKWTMLIHRAFSSILIGAIMLFALALDPLGGALSDFNKKVDKERKENKQKHNSPPAAFTNDDADDMSGLFDVLFLLIMMGPPLKGYTSYPYSDSEKSYFVVHEEAPGTIPSPVGEGEGLPTSGFFLAVDIGGQYAYANGMGAYAALTGRFWKYLGPECEYRRIWDGTDYLDIFAAGINLPVIQFSGFMLELYGQGSWIRGVTRLTGWAAGVVIRSFPIRPLVLQLRCGYHGFDDIGFVDLEGRAGIVLWRMEFFGGYRYFKAKYAQIDGPVFGVRFWI